MVTAVFADLPSESNLHFDFLFNWEAHKKLLQWDSNDFQSFVKLSPDANPKAVAYKINQYLSSRIDQLSGTKIQLGLQSFSKRYLFSNFENGAPVNGRIEYIRLFSWVAIFILIIACINFMNLATARSVKRAKEIGLRKVIGSSRYHLIAQFFGESLMFAFLAMAISVVLIVLMLPSFNHFTVKQISNPVDDANLWLYLISLTIITGLISGIYPALYLSSLMPVKVLKGVFRYQKNEKKREIGF